MSDPIFESWLQDQFREGMTFARQSPVLDLAPAAGAPPYRYLSRFKCAGLASIDNRITTVHEHLVGIQFPDDYLRVSCDPGRVLTWLGPENAFHPNILPPFCCVGHIPPGMSLMSLLHQLFQMISWQRFTPVERDALNREACRWGRRHLDRLPVDPRRSMREAQGSRPANVDGGEQ